MSQLELLIRAVQDNDVDAVRRILDSDQRVVSEKDASGATALHYAAFNGHREIAKLLVERGADINDRDDKFGATPAGWVIEYLRELGGHLAIELEDLAYAIETRDHKSVARFLTRFPDLRKGSRTKKQTFRQMAQDCGDPAIIALFDTIE